MPDTVTMPKLGFDMQEGKLVRWVKSEGEPVAKGDVLAEIETDKATVEVTSNFSGVMYRHLVEQDTFVPVGNPIAVITAPGEKVADLPAAGVPAIEPKVGGAEITPAPVEVPSSSAATDTGRLKISPLARKMAKEANLDLSQIKGSGSAGRITSKDVKAILAAPKSTLPEVKPVEIPRPSSTEVPGPAPKWIPGVIEVEDKVIPMDRLRMAIGRRMVEAKQAVPHFYITHEYNLEPLLKLRVQLNSYLPEDQKLTVNDFIIRAVALTLRQFPNINASIHGNEIVQHGHINIGVAVAVPGGLLTVVVKDADVKPIRSISAEVRDMVSRARAGKVRPEDIEGSTFSISNLGMFDVEHFIAIINPPEAAILAVGSAKQVPVVVDGEVRVGTRMRATISADHRVTDGAEAAQFVQALAVYLEEPVRLLV
ncbi:MAG TPA: dihydrolipoamide acetyltransferase family protein [Anaerolineaceae bacterium]